MNGHRFKKIVGLVACVLSLFVSESRAAEYLFFLGDMPAAPGVSDAGQIREVYLSFDTNSKTLRWITKYIPDPITNALPSGAVTVITGGPMPMEQGQGATFYIDWTNPANPSVTAYGYGANGPFNSHFDGGKAPGVQAPDRIVSSKNSPGFMKRLVVSPYLNGIEVDLELDMSPILNHVPLYTNQNNLGWYQPGIGPMIGIWHYPISHADFDYYSSGAGAGFVSCLFHKYKGNYDVTDLPLFSKPECTPSTTEEVVVRVGKPYAGSVLATDVGFNNTLEQLRVNYTGLPQGAVVDPAENALRTPPFSALVNWTPAASDQGLNYTINVTVRDPVGLEATCPLRVRVPENLPPVCDLSATAPTQTCGGAITTVEADGTKSSDPEGDPLSHSWTVQCSDPSAFTTAGLGLKRTITLGDPGLGKDVTCTVNLTVSDGVDSASCATSIAVSKCQVDCLGQINGTALLDQCGVCNGTNQCVDCKGVINGTSKRDRCNVCDGDGKSCLLCKSEDATPTKFALDGRAADQHQFNRQLGRTLKSVNPKSRRYVSQILNVSRELYNDSWHIVWEGLAATIVDCENDLFCSAVDNGADLLRFSQNVEALRAIAVQLTDRIANTDFSSNKLRRLRSRAGSLLRNSLSTAATVKKSESCT